MNTDKQLQDDVIAELNGDPAVTATRIGVVVKDGVVTLSGEVRDVAHKLSVEHVVQRVSGVKALAIELKIASAGHANENDAEVGRCVEAGLQMTKEVRHDALKVVVEHGVVTLTGDVDSGNEKRAALDSVRYLRGVTGVTDEIAVRPSVTVSAVKVDIAAALHRVAASDATRISVEVHGDEVTLSGSVQTSAQRRVAIQSAQATPGVRHVVDKLAIDE
jgi:osmotically-inducible protein OsmY